MLPIVIVIPLILIEYKVLHTWLAIDISGVSYVTDYKITHLQSLVISKGS